MTLIDPTATKQVEIGDDSYTLRLELGFYEQEKMTESGIRFHFPPDWDGKDFSKLTASNNRADRALARLSAYLAGWSHDEALTLDNIKRLPQAHARQLIAEIEDIEAARPLPFWRESDDTTDNRGNDQG